MNRAVKAFLILWTLIFSSEAFSALQCRSLFLDPAGVPSYRFQINEFSETLSQEVRDNHLDYSYFIKSYASKIKKSNPDLYPVLMKLLQFKGWVAGDNHSGNYIVAPVNGKMHYYFVDIKDGGLGPVFYNFANLVLNTHAVTKRSKSAKIYEVADLLMETYLKGLKGERMPAPEPVRKALETPVSEYRRLENKDVDRFLNHQRNGFNFDKRNLEPVTEFTESFNTLKKNMSEQLLATGKVTKVLDFAIREKDRGGSKDLERYWTLVEMKSGDLRIIEFKEVNLPAAQVVQSSGMDLQSHTEKMMQVYFPAQDPMIKSIELDGKLFMMRPRKADLMSVPYKQKSEADLLELLSYARYAAYTTGLKQAASSAKMMDYIKLLETHSAEVQLIVRQLIKDYYDHLEEKMFQGEV